MNPSSNFQSVFINLLMKKIRYTEKYVESVAVTDRELLDLI